MFGGWFGGGSSNQEPEEDGSEGNTSAENTEASANASGGGVLSGAFSFMKGMLGMDQLKVEETEGENKTDIDEGKRKGLFSQLSSYVGKDITSMISLPVWIFEPLSFLQIMSEPLQYEALLQKVLHSQKIYIILNLQSFIGIIFLLLKNINICCKYRHNIPFLSRGTISS